MSMRWKSVTHSTAHGSLGPKVKAHGIWLVKDGNLWKLDRWAPGR